MQWIVRHRWVLLGVLVALGFVFGMAVVQAAPRPLGGPPKDAPDALPQTGYTFILNGLSDAEIEAQLDRAGVPKGSPIRAATIAKEHARVAGKLREPAMRAELYSVFPYSTGCKDGQECIVNWWARDTFQNRWYDAVSGRWTS